MFPKISTGLLLTDSNNFGFLLKIGRLGLFWAIWGAFIGGGYINSPSSKGILQAVSIGKDLAPAASEVIAFPHVCGAPHTGPTRGGRSTRRT